MTDVAPAPRASTGPLIRAIGVYRVEQHIDGQPEGWTFVRLLDANGVPYFAGVLHRDELAVELVVQLERARAYSVLVAAKQAADAAAAEAVP